MNPETKTYKKIEDAKKEIEFFKRLVVLPYEDTPPIRLPSEFSLKFDEWKKICEKNELHMFLSNPTRWEAFFDGRFGAGIRKKIKIKKKGLLS